MRLVLFTFSLLLFLLIHSIVYEPICFHLETICEGTLDSEGTSAFYTKRVVLEQNMLNTFSIIQMLRPPIYCWISQRGALGLTLTYCSRFSTPTRLFEKNKPLGYPNQISFEYLGLGSFKKSTGVVYQHIMKRWRSTSRPRPGVCT